MSYKPLEDRLVLRNPNTGTIVGTLPIDVVALPERTVQRYGTLTVTELRQKVVELEAKCRYFEDMLWSDASKTERKDLRDKIAECLDTLDYRFRASPLVDPDMLDYSYPVMDLESSQLWFEHLNAEIEVLKIWKRYAMGLQNEHDALIEHQKISSNRSRLPPQTEKPEICQYSLEQSLRMFKVNEKSIPESIERLVKNFQAAYIRCRTALAEADHRQPEECTETKKTEKEDTTLLRTRSPFTSWVFFWGTYLLYGPKDGLERVHAYTISLDALESDLSNQLKFKLKGEEKLKSLTQELRDRYSEISRVQFELEGNVSDLEPWMRYAHKLEKKITQIREAIKQQRRNKRLNRKSQENVATDSVFQRRTEKGHVPTFEEMERDDDLEIDDDFLSRPDGFLDLLEEQKRSAAITSTPSASNEAPKHVPYNSGYNPSYDYTDEVAISERRDRELEKAKRAREREEEEQFKKERREDYRRHKAERNKGKPRHKWI